jgi:hypothetical protein|tara:strand:- start:405 stop:599 length:195 start_codon:yes stop_codon:yes gene_type:complete
MKTSIAHKIEIENNGDLLDMMTAIEAIFSSAYADELGTSYEFEDGSRLVFNGSGFERIEPTKEQ